MKNKSFTLIELLVVIVIIGILAGVIMISTSSSINKASIAKLKVFEESVANDLAANMVSRWKLDGDFTDSWGNSNGTNNGVTFSSESQCISVQCGNFNGANYIDCGNNDALSVVGDITISAWIKPSTLSSMGMIIRNGYSRSPYVFYRIDDDLEFYYTINGSWGGIRAYNALSTNQWYYLVATRVFVGSNATLKIYINSYEASSIARSGVPDYGNTNVSISYDNNAGYFFAGLMDDIRIYDAALSSARIKQDYILGLNLLLKNGGILKQEYNQRINELAYEQK